MQNLLKIIVLLYIFSLNAADIVSLPSSEIEKLKSGHFVIKKTPIVSRTWPKHHVYKLVSGEPFEVMALFSAYEQQPLYVPNLLKAKVTNQKHSLHTIVDYQRDLPWPLSKSDYSMEHLLSIDEKKNVYILNWKQLSSSDTKINEGKVSFSKFEETNLTLMIYESEIEPLNSFAGSVLKDVASRNLEKDLKAIVEFININIKNNTKIYLQAKDVLRKSINGENVY